MSGSSVEIRVDIREMAIREGDILAVAEMLRRLEAADAPAVLGERRRDYFVLQAIGHLRNKDQLTLMAWAGTEPVGLLLTRDDGNREVFCYGFWVAPEAPGRTAWKLLEAAAAWATVRGATVAHISTAPGVNAKRRFYRRMGFVPVTTIQSARMEDVRRALRMTDK